MATAEGVAALLGMTWLLTHTALTVGGAWDHQRPAPAGPSTVPIPTQPQRRVIVVPAYPPAVPA